jgi:hypothetical protein
MVTRYNPSVHQEPRNQPLLVIPLIETESLLIWLKRTGRLKPREVDLFHGNEVLEDLEYILNPEIYDTEKEEETSDVEE